MIATKRNIPTDVICQHKTDGGIIPLRIRFTDDDGLRQIYTIHSYREMNPFTDGYRLPSGVDVTSYMKKFECKITVFNEQRTINLLYNANDGIWLLLA
ncbi:MAG: hypothetical protein K6B75_03870 [Lachnospiraceae bacterium]|nr:hypothetical protein [Lachnospiraceae bacterium]